MVMVDLIRSAIDVHDAPNVGLFIAQCSNYELEVVRRWANLKGNGHARRYIRLHASVAGVSP
jgi:putative component of membrane protein insertase Oxa1/YidC/SpoIIIJ protein YidD